jgi:hypothetical protein
MSERGGRETARRARWRALPASLALALGVSAPLARAQLAPATTPTRATQSGAEIERTVRSAPWRREEIAVGVRWLAHHFPELGPGPQNVHVLELDPSEVELRPARPPRGFAPTSRLARESDAVAAVNGGFFGPRGEAIGLLRIDGAELFPASEGAPWVLGIPERGPLRFERRTSGTWDEVRHALAGKPLLVKDGRIVPQDLGGARHPRTAIGQRADGVRVLLTCDGRARESLGLSVGELAHLLRGLRCTDALNLDGGGSTTLWVRDEPEGGIANCPCDDKRFDPAGERAVSNALLVHARDILELDEDEAGLVLEPASAWRRVENDARALHGDYARASAPERAAVRTSYLPRRAGRLALELRFAPGISALVVELPGSQRRVDRRVGSAGWVRAAEIDAREGTPIPMRVTALPGEEQRFDALRWVELFP